MAELTSMQNIGAEMARKLAAVGIHTPEELRRAGAKHAYFKLKEVFPKVCLVICTPWRGQFKIPPTTAFPKRPGGI